MFPSKNMVQMAFGNNQNNGQKSQIPPDLFRQGVIEHATSLGMDPAVDGAFLWIAEKSLLEPLPLHWIQLNTNEGDVYYYNQMNGESSWEHPKDDYYRKLFFEKKALRSSGICSHIFIKNKSNLRNDSEMYEYNYYNDQNQVRPNLRRRNVNSPNYSDIDGRRSVDHTVQRPKTAPLLSKSVYKNQQHSYNLNERSSKNNRWIQSLPSDQNLILEKMNHANVELIDQLNRKHDVQEKIEEQNNMTDAQNTLNFLKEEMGKLSLADEAEVNNRNGNHSPDLLKKSSTSKISEISKQSHLSMYNRPENSKANDVMDFSLKQEEEIKSNAKLNLVADALQKENDDLKQLMLKKDMQYQEELEKFKQEREILEKEQKHEKEENNIEEFLLREERQRKEMQANHQRKVEGLNQNIKSLEAKLVQIQNENERNCIDVESLEKEIGQRIESQATILEKNKLLEDKLKCVVADRDSSSKRIDHLNDLMEDASSAKNELMEQINELKKRSQSFERSTKEMSIKFEQANESLMQQILKTKLKEEENMILQEESETWKMKYNKEKEKTKSMNDKIIELQGNIRVICRVRPLSSKEQRDLIADGKDPSDIQKAIQYLDDDKLLFYGTEYNFDRIFAPNAVQGSVFSEIAPAVRSVMNGHSVCIFAYGQTGSGKTHTMEGNVEDRGMNYRALTELFDVAKRATHEMDFVLLASVVEVYNELIFDSLVKSNTEYQNQALSIHMRKEQVYVEGVVERKVTCFEDVEAIMALASSNRRTANNNVNERSSRSHLVLSIKARGKDIKTGTRINGKLNLIDLAGSERLKSTVAHGQRLKEAQNINRSLSALGDVVAALGCGSKHVPYRNSKLTFLLQDSLCANARVIMFVNINPSPISLTESVCSLRFATRCRSVHLGKSRRDSNGLLGKKQGSFNRRPSVLESGSS